MPPTPISPRALSISPPISGVALPPELKQRVAAAVEQANSASAAAGQLRAAG